eukprot:3553796-Amphidinium_carterae.2
MVLSHALAHGRPVFVTMSEVSVETTLPTWLSGGGGLHMTCLLLDRSLNWSPQRTSPRKWKSSSRS